VSVEGAAFSFQLCGTLVTQAADDCTGPDPFLNNAQYVKYWNEYWAEYKQAVVRLLAIVQRENKFLISRADHIALIRLWHLTWQQSRVDCNANIEPVLDKARELVRKGDSYQFRDHRPNRGTVNRDLL